MAENKSFCEDEIVSRLINTFCTDNPAFLGLLEEDVFTALETVDDLSVVRSSDDVGDFCSILGCYDLETRTAYIYDCGNTGRLSFTALHELGHHLLAKDEQWNFDIELNALERRKIEERMVNSFAARILIPDSLVEEQFRRTVTAEGIYKLFQRTRASLAACCARALVVPGERIVIYGSTKGDVWFSASNSASVSSPSRSVKQPLLIESAEKTTDGSFRLSGGTGLQYKTGWQTTSLEFSGYISGRSVVLVGEETHGSRRGFTTGEKIQQDCAQCGAIFSPSKVNLFCNTCSQVPCPECGYCGCREEKGKICPECFLEMSPRETELGLASHEDCSSSI